MISFPPIHARELEARVQDVIRKAFALAQSAQDVATAIRGIFTSSLPGSKTLTLGTTAPDFIQTTTATRFLTIVESDGRATTIVGWR